MSKKIELSGPMNTQDTPDTKEKSYCTITRERDEAMAEVKRLRHRLSHLRQMLAQLLEYED